MNNNAHHKQGPTGPIRARLASPPATSSASPTAALLRIPSPPKSIAVALQGSADDINLLRNAAYGTTNLEPAAVEAAQRKAESVLAVYRDALRPAGDDAVLAVIKVLSASFPPPRIDDDAAAIRVDVYLEMLGSLPADILAEATRQALKQFRFFPTVAELYAIAEPLLDGRVCAANRIAGLLGTDYLPRPRAFFCDLPTALLPEGLGWDEQL